jgi:hypothetical protein
VPWPGDGPDQLRIQATPTKIRDTVSLHTAKVDPNVHVRQTRGTRSDVEAGVQIPFPTESHLPDHGKRDFHERPCASLYIFKREIADLFEIRASSLLDEHQVHMARTRPYMCVSVIVMAL